MDIRKIWEDFAATWKGIITGPEEFFAAWNPAEDWQKVIVFNVICGLIGGLLTAVFTFFIGTGEVIRYPLVVLAGTFVGGIVLFVCFKLFGGKGDVGPTIKMMGYTQAVRVFHLGIPIIGFPISFLASIYQLWLLVVAGKAVHGLDTTKAVLAVLLPVIVMGFLALLSFILFGVATVGYMMHGGGG